MTEDYGVDEQTLETQEFLAGSHPVVLVPIVVESGVGTLSAGRVLGRNSTGFKYHDWDPDATDGTETAVAVLARDVDATSADISTVAYVHGEFRQAKLGWGSADDTEIAQAVRDLQSASIFIKADQV